MYRRNKQRQTSIVLNNSSEGEMIQTKVSRIVNNKEPIKDGAPRLYTLRADGVKPEMNIRTDKFEVALDTMTEGAKRHEERRLKGLGEVAKENMEIEKKSENGGAESTDTTEK